MRLDDFHVRDDLLYSIPADCHDHDEIVSILKAHPEVRYVSLVGVDLLGNDTDEKIPVSLFCRDIDNYLDGGVETDGSSVFLPFLVSINDAAIDLVADKDVHWFIDYNYENVDQVTGKPWGTLRIPAFLVHNGRMVCSRSTLKRALEAVDAEFRALAEAHPEFLASYGLTPDDVERYVAVIATELEFWVRTPDDIISREHLSTSQTLKEQYWKRTKGVVRSALEQTLYLLELYGFGPEMGHKEVGGVKAHLREGGQMDHILEQLEIDWRFTVGMQAADNELAIRILTKEVFRLHGLEASFMAKPIVGVAGNGEHLHINLAAVTHDGRRVNLFSPPVFQENYLSAVGWGSLMGLTKHYRDLVAPFVTASIDAFNRLKPGYEAPTHVTASIGRGRGEPSRNRTVLVCLVRSEESPGATRLELRAPNPHTNLFLAVSSVLSVMIDGVIYAVESNKSARDLEEEWIEPKKSAYMPSDRIYRSEEDIFSVYSEEERDSRYGRPAAHVYETLKHLVHSKELDILYRRDVFFDRLIRAYAKAALDAWELELRDRVLADNLARIRSYVRHEGNSPFDENRWQKIDELRHYLAVSSDDQLSLFDRIREALESFELSRAWTLQLEMDTLMERLEVLYSRYEKNLID